MYTQLLEPDQIPHTQSMVAKRGLTNRATVHTPFVRKSSKTQRGRIPIDPAGLAAIGHRFIAKKSKQKMLLRFWGDAHKDQKLETFCLAS